MASVTMTASFLGGATLSDRSPATTRGRLIITNSSTTSAKASSSSVGTNQEVRKNIVEISNSTGRRDLMFAAAAAAVCSAAGVAVAEPKRGTPEAKKIYAPVCVTMPTAKICHK